MKIIHFCETLSIGGGISSFIKELSYEQCKSNEVSIGVINSDINTNRVSLHPSITVVDFDKRHTGFSIKYPIRIYQYLRRINPDVVHIHSSFFYYFLSVLLLHKRIRFIYTVHSDAYKENAGWDKRLWKIKKWCFKLDWIRPVTISPTSKYSFDSLYELDSLMIVNGIKKPKFILKSEKFSDLRFTDDTLVLFHPARITEAKNQILLCEVVSQLILEGYDLVLVIAGVCQDNSIFQQLKGYFSERIVYWGERSDVINLLSEADAMCLSSIWEGLPISLLEAMSVGCIPICTPVGGIKDVIHNGLNGFIADDVDAKSYKEAILHFINLSEKSKQIMKDNIRKSFNDYDISDVSAKYLRIYSF